MFCECVLAAEPIHDTQDKENWWIMCLHNLLFATFYHKIKIEGHSERHHFGDDITMVMG